MFVELSQSVGENAESRLDLEDTYSEEEVVTFEKIPIKAPEMVQVPLQERHPLEFAVILIGATALSFNAGFVNGCTYQFRGIPVSHITGTTTHAGMNVGAQDWESFAINMAVIVSFVFGSSITGYMMPQNSFHLGREYGPLFLIGSLLFSLACALSYHWPHSNYYFYFAAMACGLQNAMTSKYSGNIIRTTHMTGTATDIGLVLGRVCKGDTKEIWKLQVLGPIYLSFLIGGAVSVPVFKKLGNLSLLINVLVFFSIGLAYSITINTQLHIPLWKAFFGYYTTIEKKVKNAKEVVHNVQHKLKDNIHNVLHTSQDTAANPMHSTGSGKNNTSHVDDDNWEG